MDHTDEVHSSCSTAQCESATVADTEDSVQETGNREQMEIEVLHCTSFQSMDVKPSTIEINSDLISQLDQSCSDNTEVLAATTSPHKLDFVASQIQIAGAFHPTDLTGGIARSRKGMKLNDPEAFTNPPEQPSSHDMTPVLPKTGCSHPSFVARQKQRLAEKGERFVAEVVYNATLANAVPAYYQPGNTSCPSDQHSISSANISKTQSVISDSGDVSSCEKESAKDLLAPRWGENSNFRVYAAYPAVVENVMMVSAPHPSLQDLMANNVINTPDFPSNPLQICSSRMISLPEEMIALRVTPAVPADAVVQVANCSSYGSGIELEILGEVREGFNDASSDEDDALEIETDASGRPAYRVGSRGQELRKRAKKGFFRRIFRHVAKKINKRKTPTTLNTSVSLELGGSVPSPAIDLAEEAVEDDADSSKDGKKRAVRNPGEAITFGKTLN